MKLGSHSEWGPKLGLSHVRARLREPEVSDDKCVVVQEDIGQLEVSMHHFLLVEHSEASHDLLEVGQGFGLGQELVRSMLQELFKVAPVAVLDDEVEVVSADQVLVQVHNVRVLDFLHYLHLVFQKLLQLEVLCDFLCYWQTLRSWGCSLSRTFYRPASK